MQQLLRKTAFRVDGRVACSRPRVHCRHATRRILRVQAQTKNEEESESTSASQPPVNPDRLSEDEIRRLAALRRQQMQSAESSGNILQGALEEAQLITWPTPQKAFFDTFLVLGIVAGTGLLLLGVNFVLSNGANWWYHTPHPAWLKG